MTPSLEVCLLNLLSALSKDSFSFTSTLLIYIPSLRNLQGQILIVYSALYNNPAAVVNIKFLIFS